MGSRLCARHVVWSLAVEAFLAVVIFWLASLIPSAREQDPYRCVVGFISPKGAVVLRLPGAVLHNPRYLSSVKAGDMIVAGDCLIE